MSAKRHICLSGLRDVDWTPTTAVLSASAKTFQPFNKSHNLAAEQKEGSTIGEMYTYTYIVAGVDRETERP